MNHEAYFFGSKHSKRVFERRPYEWCGSVTDPVTLERFEPEPQSPMFTYEGRPYYFSSEESLTAFLSDPEMYWKPKNRMRATPMADAAQAVGSPPMATHDASD